MGSCGGAAISNPRARSGSIGKVSDGSDGACADRIRVCLVVPAQTGFCQDCVSVSSFLARFPRVPKFERAPHSSCFPRRECDTVFKMVTLQIRSLRSCENFWRELDRAGLSAATDCDV